MKKLVSLILAIMMIAAVGAAWAAGDDGRTINNKTNTYTGSNQSEATSMAESTSIPLTKSIVFVNANGSSVYEPNITYTYTVAPAGITDNQYTVTDNSDPARIGYVKNGIASGVTGTEISFGITLDETATTAVAAASTGTEVERTGNLTVDLTKFSQPGIYRYVITETSNPENPASVGITARTSNYITTRYLDVYIRRDETTSNLEMYGAVIFKSIATTAGQDSISVSTNKTTGFEPASTSNLTTDETVDRYVTYDFEVKKLTAGSLADTSHEFPFYVNITNTITGAKYTYTPDTGTATAETISGTSIAKGTDANTSTLTLKHNDSIKFVGVPSNQTSALSIDVKEWNDSYDIYTATVTVRNGTAPTVTNGNNMAARSTTAATIATFDIKANDAANQLMTVTNTVNEISPTGYVSRFAPYALILVAGIALLIVAKKRKPVKDDEE